MAGVGAGWLRQDGERVHLTVAGLEALQVRAAEIWERERVALAALQEPAQVAA